jgi:hypothetical protein
MAGTSPKEVINIARKELGTDENPSFSNRTKYGAWYGMDGVAWCAMFVSWCLSRAGFGTDYKHAYTPYGVDMFKRMGDWHSESNAKPGDIVYFDFPDSVYRVQHVGIVESNNPGAGTMVCLEGNTNGAGSDDGGSVMRHTRPYSYIVGVGRPDYERKKKFKIKAHRAIKWDKGDWKQIEKQLDAIKKGRSKKWRVWIDFSPKKAVVYLRLKKALQNKKFIGAKVRMLRKGGWKASKDKVKG